LNRVVAKFRKRAEVPAIPGEDLPAEKDGPVTNELSRAARGGSD